MRNQVGQIQLLKCILHSAVGMAQLQYRPARSQTSCEPVCDQVRVGSSYLDMSRQLESGRTWSQTSSKPNFRSQIPLRYPDRRPRRRPAASWNLAYHALSSSLAASQQVCDQYRTCLRPGQRNGIWLIHAGVTACRLGRWEVAGSTAFCSTLMQRPCQDVHRPSHACAAVLGR